MQYRVNGIIRIPHSTGRHHVLLDRSGGWSAIYYQHSLDGVNKKGEFMGRAAAQNSTESRLL